MAVVSVGTLQFDPGSQWTISGTANSSGLGTTTITGFTQGDTIDLTGFAAVGQTSSADTLVLNDALSGTATLHLQGSLASSNFLLSPDGNGGTFITPGLPQPTIIADDTTDFLGGGPAVTLDPTITITDPQSTTLAGATVAIDAGFVAGDQLNFTQQNGISGKFDASSGVLALSGVASIADYEAALESVTYGFSPPSGDPTLGGTATSRGLSWIVDDGKASSSAGKSALTVTHAAPTLDVSGKIDFAGGGAPVTLAPGLTLADPDSGGLLSLATVAIKGVLPGDVLSVDTAGTSITSGYSQGVLTLSGTDTIANYQTVLQQVRFGTDPADIDPTGGGSSPTRELLWSVNDGSVQNGASNTGSVFLTTTHTPPFIDPTSKASYTGGGVPVAAASQITLVDPDSSGTLAGATVSIADLDPGDQLAFTSQNGISGTYQPQSGVLTLFGTATIADYRTALQSITYSYAPGGDPTAGGTHLTRTLNWTVTDGNSTAGESNTGVSGITVAHAPPIVAAGGSVSFAGGGLPVALDPTITVADPDSAGLLSEATVSIGGFIPGDRLNFVDQNNITGTYDATTGQLILNGVASIADYESALASISYGFAPAGDPTGGGQHTARTITWVVDDKVAASLPATSGLTTVHTSPALVVDGKAVFTGGGAPVLLDRDVTVVTPDSRNLLSGATVALSGGFLPGDVLSFAGQPGIMGNYDPASGVLTLTGEAPAAAYRAALESVTYGFSPPDGDATAGGTDPGRVVTWTINDGVASSVPITSSVGQIHVGPTIAVGGKAAFTGGGAPIVLSPAITITDPDSGGTIASAQVAVTDFVPGDQLGFVDQAGISGMFDNTTGTLHLSGRASIAAYETALASVTYGFAQGQDPSIDGRDTARAITWAVSDGQADSALAVSDLTVIDAAPTVDVSGTASYIVNAPPVLLDPSLALSDPDSGGRLAGARISISAGLAAGDLLDFVDQNGIAGVYDPAGGSLTLTGTASVADYTTALRSIAFQSTAVDPTVGGSDAARTITWRVIDPAETGSAPRSSTVAVAFAPPVIAGTAGNQATTDEQAIAPFASVSITDPNPNQIERVTVIQSDPAQGVLSGLGQTSVPGRYTVLGTPAQVTAALRAAVFTPTVDEVPPNQSVTTGFELRVRDNAEVGARDTTTSVVATSVANPPTITHAGEVQGVPGQAGNTPFASITIADQDVGTTQTVTVALDDPTGGTFSNLAGGSFDAAAGVYTITGSAAQVTTVLQGLVFTAAPPINGAFVRTTTFTITATGPAGSVTDTSFSVTTASQVLGLSNQGTQNAVVSVSSDGTGFATAQSGKVNQAVIGSPAQNGAYQTPAGYQAVFLGGGADATLVDDTETGVLLVGNTGNDTISAAADRVTMTGGAGTNTFVSKGNANVIGTSGPSTVLTAGTGSSVYVGGGNLALSDSGSGTQVGLSTGDAAVNLAGSGAAVFGGAGKLAVADSGTGNVIGASTGDLSATVSGSGGRVYGGDGNLAVAVTTAASGVAIGTGAGQAALTIGGSLATVYGGAGGLTAVVTGTSDVVGLGAGDAALTLGGGAAQVNGGSGALSVLDNGTADTISTGTGPARVTAAGASAVVANGGGDLQFLAAAGSSTVFGGAGASTVTGGGGAVTTFGGAGGAITYQGVVGQAVYQAGAGAETLNGAGATSGIVVNGGIDTAGQDRLIAGSGNDSLYAGTGAATMTGGAGADQFVFYRSVLAGAAPADVITDLGNDDVVYLAGYGANEAAGALASATAASGGTTVTLSDNTKLTFLDVSTANLVGHIVSF